jgi:hypothetical protein
MLPLEEFGIYIQPITYQNRADKHSSASHYPNALPQ